MTAESLVSVLLQILSRPGDDRTVVLRDGELISGDQRFPLAQTVPAKDAYLAWRLGLQGVPLERLASIWSAALAEGQPFSARELLTAARRPEIQTEQDAVLRRWRAVIEPILRQSPAAATAVESFESEAAAPDLSSRLELRPLLETWPRRLLHDRWWATAEAPLPNMSPLPLDEVWVDLQMLDPGEWPVLAGLESLRSLLDQRYEERRWQSEPLALVVERLHGVVAFIGPPGSGKTTLLKWIARRLIQEPGSRYLLPLFVPLRRYVLSRQEGGEPGLLRFALHQCGIQRPEQKSLWIQVLNELAGTWRERVLVLLDGWDEVPAEERVPLLQELRDLAYGFSVLVTSRPAAFPSRLAASRVYEVADLAPDGIDALIHRWFRGAGAPGQSAALLRHLEEHPDLRRLARNPFLLTLLCGICHEARRRENRELPATRTALYERTLGLIYAQHDEGSPHAPFSSGRKRQIERLALWLLDAAPGAPRFVFGPEDVAASGGDADLLPRYLKPSRLLGQLGPDDDTHHFLHATFQEYLAAAALDREPHGEAVERLRAHLHDAAWQEVFHFLAARPGPLRDAFWREMSALAARPDRFGLIAVRLARWVATADGQDGGKGLVGRDLRELLWPLVERLTASRIWVDAYAELDAAGFVRRTEAALEKADPRLRTRLQRTLNRVRSTAASRALVDQVLSGDAQQAAVAATQLHLHVDAEGLRRLHEAAGDPTRGEASRRQAVRALGYAKDLDAVSLLVRVADEDRLLGEEVVRTLGRIGGPEATAALVALLARADGPLQRDAARALGEMRDAPARDALLDEIARRPPDDPLIGHILQALAEIPIHRGAELIVDLLGSEAPGVRCAAVWALAEATGRGVFEGLRTAVDDAEEEVRCAALEVFERRARLDDADWLLERLRDPSRSSDERGFALRALLSLAGRSAHSVQGQWLSAIAVEVVLLALRDPEGDLALEAVAHAHHAGPSVAPRLIDLCLDSGASPGVRELACVALGKMHARAAAETLLSLVRAAPDADEDEDQPLETGGHRIARAAAEALARIDAGLLLREPGSTAFNALARFAVETGCLVYDDRIVGPDGREWARAAAQLGADTPSRLESLMEESTVSPPDLEIRVWIESEGGKQVLMYLLHSASGKAGLHFHMVRGPELPVPPEVFARQIFDQIEKLHEGYDVDGHQLLLTESAKDLESLGRWLYSRLFSHEMTALYRRFHKVVRTLQITTAEAAIPWELVKPFDKSDRTDIIDDDFLCLHFQLTRWLSGPASPRPLIPLRRLACIEGSEPAASGLPKVSAERQLLADLAHRHPGVDDASPTGATFAVIESLFVQGEIDLYHFVGHGDFEADSPAEAKIVLVDRPFRARHLSGSIQTRLSADRPFVVFSACRVGRQGWSLAGLDGWAQAWVGDCECGAFIGPLWLVKDSAAYEHARVLYSELESGKTLGEASQAARKAVRDLDPGRPNWLAFAVYGHPNARMTFGLESPGKRSEREPRNDPVQFAKRERSHEALIAALRRNSDRIRKGLEPYLLPRIPRREVHEKYLPVIRESVTRKRSRIIPILGSAGYGKSTVLGEIYDALRSEDHAWIGLVDSAELSLSTPTDLPLSLSRAACEAALPFENLAIELSRSGPGVLLIDTLDLLLSPAIVPHLQRLLFALETSATTVVFTCRDVDYQLLLEPPRLRLPQVFDRIDRYTVPAFTEPEVAQAARAFVDASPRLRGTLAGDAFVDRLKSLAADSRSLQGITSNPLLLAMLCEVFGEEGDLPRDLTVSDLYARYWEEKVARSRTRGPGDPVVIEKPRLCLRIAQHLLEQWHEVARDWVIEPDLAMEGSATVAQARLELLSEGILKQVAGNRVRFFHQTFLEYAMARWLATGSGYAGLKRVLGAVRTGENTALHWWPVLRQLLVVVEAEELASIVGELSMESLVAFRTVSFASATRGDLEHLDGLLQRSLELGAEFQKTLCAAVESAPARALDGAWAVVETLLRSGTRDAAISATSAAGALLARDRIPLVERLGALMDAVDERTRRTGDREEGSEIMGQLVRASLPALKASSDPLIPRLLQDRYLSFGERGRGVIIDLFRTTPMSGQSRQEFVRFLLERPPERRLQAQLVELLELVLRFEGVESRASIEERMEILYRSVPEPWISFHARAAARVFAQDSRLATELCRDLLSPQARSPRCDTNALEEMVHLGQVDTICEALSGMPTDDIPSGRIGSLATLVRELSRKAATELRRKLAWWLKSLAETRSEEAFEVFASVADADDETWVAFLALLRGLSEAGKDRLAKRAIGEVPRAALDRLAPEIEALASRHAGKVSFEYALVDLYSLQIGESEEAETRLVGLSLSSSKGVALAASNSFAQAAKKGSYPSVARLLPLMGSSIPGVRDHLMETVVAIQQHGIHMASDEVVQLCEGLAGESNSPTLQKLCKVVTNWVRTENRAPLAVVRTMADLTLHLQEGGPGAGVAGALIRALKVMAQLEKPELTQLLQLAAQRSLRGIEHLNRLSVGESEMIDLLSALARVDGSFLARLVDDGPNLPPRNIRALATAIRRVEGPSSPLITRILDSEWCPPHARSAILEFLGA